ncbi:hypothetical protein NECAME_12966 [Necator americanus]|uniref:Uncharacterized protein n=1 Tax=Necator americanus TaxID=51031 RepID=W2SZM3_NECAM|nr:hypothetical protein NECAME_12966 [Necator americanus]ETN74446.1 hypothetical protein NECAME_12966 [Necator americanus]
MNWKTKPIDPAADTLDENCAVTTEPVSASKRTANISKKSSRPSLRRREPAPVPPQTSHSHLVSEAIALATSKGLRGGYIEFLRSNTDESIKRSL